MDREIFAAGVQPGAPSTKNEVKALLCWLLGELREPVPFGLLHEALREDGLVNYFELCDALSRLCETSHLYLEERDGLELYAALPRAEQAATELIRMIPAAVRAKALRAVRRMLARRKRLSQVHVDIREENGGYMMTLALPDSGTELVSFTVFAPTRQECEKLRRHFLNDPVFLYKGVMSLLTGQRDVLGDPLPEAEELF